ncbi:MAG TPA: hypothetical protein VG406_25855 [Isosphaeraceae bacterium]|jgi:hypothetical protein|nr:hypothetical protein [Isosphaeraceae bacterium]
MIMHLPEDIGRDILAEVHRGHCAPVDDALARARRSLRRQEPAPAMPKAAKTPGKKTGRAKAAPPEPKGPLTPDEAAAEGPAVEDPNAQP